MQLQVRPIDGREEYEFEIRLHDDGSLDIEIEDESEKLSILLTRDETNRLREMLMP